MITAAQVRALGSILRMMENFMLKGISEEEALRLRAVLRQFVPETIEGRAVDFLLETDRALAKVDIAQAARAMDMAMKELVVELREQKGAHASPDASPTTI